MIMSNYSVGTLMKETTTAVTERNRQILVQHGNVKNIEGKGRGTELMTMAGPEIYLRFYFTSHTPTHLPLHHIR